MSFTLPNLPYDYASLEPYIDSETMHLHHTKHHATYVAKLNAGIFDKSETDIVKVVKNAKELSTLVRNNGGGHYNHSLFWTWMAPVGTSNAAPYGELKSKIEATFGSLDEMKTKFNEAAASVFGSGWAWLSVKEDSLEISATPNQDNPLMYGNSIPILGLDVWEHAYYLKYQNRRPEYISQWWNVVNWDKVVEYYEQHAKKGIAVPSML